MSTGMVVVSGKLDRVTGQRRLIPNGTTLLVLLLTTVMAVVGTLFMMVQMLVPGLALWAGAAVVPQCVAVASAYEQMWDQIKSSPALDNAAAGASGSANAGAGATANGQYADSVDDSMRRNQSV
jgi:hypothetical protein